MSAPKKHNSRGNWWYADDVCKESGCNTLIDSCDNEYSYYGEGERIIRCREHYYQRHRERDVQRNAKVSAAYAMAKDEGVIANQDEWRALPKSKRDEFFALVAGADHRLTEHSNVFQFPAKDPGPSPRLKRREPVTGLPGRLVEPEKRSPQWGAKKAKKKPEPKTPKPGYLYAIVNQWVSDRPNGMRKIKLGFSDYLPQRIKDAGTWGMFEVLYNVPVSDIKSAEKEVHRIALERHENAMGEWFWIYLKDAISILDEVRLNFWHDGEEAHETK